MERVLRKDEHLKKNIGKDIQVKLFKPIEGRKQYIGILNDFNDNEIILNSEEKLTALERKNISQIKTIYKW